MQNVFVEKPYRFVPRFRARWPQWLLLRSGLLGHRLRTREGVVAHEIRQLERLEESLRAGHGILLAPNHPRTADPLVMQYVARRLNTPFYTMASWHLFNQGLLHRCALRWQPINAGRTIQNAAPMR